MSPPPLKNAIGSLVLIAATVAVSAGAFAYTAGWLTPGRLSPEKLIAALTPPTGPHPGYRRNHAKGICFTGVFKANGTGSEISRAMALKSGEYPVLGRFNLATVNPGAADATVRVRGIGLQIATPDGAYWRMAMIDPPIFAVSTPAGFYALQNAAKSADPNAMPAFVAAHPEFAAFASWAKSAPWTSSYAEDAFNSLNSFVFVDDEDNRRAVRWSFHPDAAVTPITPEALAALGSNHLEEEITERVGKAPQTWTMTVTVADPGDRTNDPTVAWPDDRLTMTVGTLEVNRIEAEPDGPCRDINFDPTILPDGVTVSDDPFPAARSATYARSYDLRTAEAKDYPRQPSRTQP
ncbi:catalase [Acuticoccus sediminis]|uniref:Catalase-related peroxidase n=1 Tax=Acuticoccus sediminis TaxID=2184697 RepID=A0A8B2NNA7_9HYPH|nr:catalase family peroxidase [Acuticoccus sediminis]RAH98348.1 catalase [Acuticoccus sediminis]